MNHVSTRASAWRAGLGIAACATLILAGCSSPSNSTATQSSSNGKPPASSSATVPAVAQGVARAIGDVPWAQVGPGWMVAVWTPVTPQMPGNQPPPGEPTPETATDVLYLVSPSGDRYAIAELPPGDDANNLLEWSPDGTRALFTSSYGSGATATSIDLHTGARTSVPVDGTPAYTLPDGKALLVSTSYNGDEPGTLKRIDTAGNEQFAYPTKDLGGAGQFSGDYVESPDGTLLVLGTANLGNEVVARSDNSLVVMSNDGSIIRTLPTPMPKAMCAPVKWWGPGVILVHCDVTRGGAEQLWTVPLDGSQPVAMTAVNTHDDAPGFEGNYGNWNAYETSSGIYLPTAGACGTSFVSRLTPDGRTEKVNIPDLKGSVELAGVDGDKLVVVGQVGCGGGTSLVVYDPKANTSTVLLGPPVTKGGGIEGARLYPKGK
jgi:hypothetical protein